MYEVKIEHLEQGMGIRVGWITKDSNLDEPVGADEHGYGYIVQSGDKVHNRKRNNYTGSAKEGDVVGCLIHLPVPGQTFEPRPQGAFWPFFLSKAIYFRVLVHSNYWCLDSWCRYRAV